jgi:hypothetical protein
MDNQSLKVFFKKFWWIFLLAILIAFSLFLYFETKKGKLIEQRNEEYTKVQHDLTKKNAEQEYKQVESRMTQGQLENANTALAGGIVIEDKTNDYYKPPAGVIQGDGKPDNSKPYPLGYSDITSVNIGADSQYLYVKVNVNNTIPTKLPIINGDEIKMLVANIELVNFINEKGKADQGSIQIGQVYVQSTNPDKELSTSASNDFVEIEPVLGTSTLISPTGKRDKTNEEIYSVHGNDGLVAGGAGTNYLLVAFPYTVYGMKYGDTLTLSLAVEANSRIYHHASTDILLLIENSKFGRQIIYKIGSNTYKTSIPKDAEKSPF